MCGVFGFFDKQMQSEQGLNLARELARLMKSRGPDDSGEWTNKQGLYFAHRRLSIIDLSAHGHQPMTSPKGQLTMVFNGEIYNYQLLRQQLEEQNYKFNGSGDSEVLIAAFEAWGFEDTLKKLVGMFAIALWSEKEQRLYLARDRMGEKPLFYGENSGRFFFASELKPIMKYPGFTKDINLTALGLFFRHNCVPAPYSIFSGLHKLEPGHFAVVDVKNLGVIEKKAYWQLVPNKLCDHSYEQALDTSKKLLLEAISKQMIADVPLGAFLSGGIDSTAIVALMQEVSDKPVKTYTIGFSDSAFDESQFAKNIAHHLKTEHTELTLKTTDALQVIEDLPFYWDEPFADSSQLPTYMVAKLTRQHVTVSLSGDGGDELFCGYSRYLMGDEVNSLASKFPGFSKSLAKTGIELMSAESWDKVFSITKPLLPSKYQQTSFGTKLYKLARSLKAESNIELYRNIASHWFEDEIILGESDFSHLQFNRASQVDCENFIAKMMYTDSHTYLPDDILTKVDRATMAVSLESRAPYLDHNLQEYVWSLPLAYKCDGITSKKILRDIVYQYVPKEMLERPKQGFAIPISDWLRGDLRDWAESYINEQNLKNYPWLNSATILKRWQEFVNKDKSWPYHMWDVLMYLSWSSKWT